MLKSYYAAVHVCLWAGFALQVGGCGPASIPSPSPPGFETVVFPNDTVQFDMPKTYKQSVEPEDTVVITPAEESGITLRFNLHVLPEPLAVDFVEMQAKEKGTKVKMIGDNATFTEKGSRSDEDHDYEMTFWQIGFDNMLVVMSAEVDQARKNDIIVVECLKNVPTMIKSMHKF
ncbi:hypothetical protein DTL42_04325 [Bremerella cremea]|uniref:Uncharacterized protein n=1 Tax=Bremerella cremea TaxID=1031537 RepID=A0A368KVI8_9BACT|nr:hypothetical protein [Bremerella cremea]RCS54379.1 hypothetical protein DTL42_04325 [Bremerella cremea]